MTRAIVLASIVGTGGLSMAAGVQDRDAPRIIRMQTLNVRDILYVLTGGGGNTLALMRDDGVVLIDTKLPGWGRSILETIQAVTDKPVTMTINTHTHPDHTGGNIEFPTATEIVAHENTKANMQKMDAFKGPNAKFLPNKTVTDHLTLLDGPDRIDLYYFGRGHTNGDAWVVFPALRLMHAGDIFSGKNIPLLDANNGGSGVMIGDTLAKAAGSVKNIDTIITGHSTTMTIADLKEYAQFNREFANDVRAAKKAGKSVDDVANTWKIPAKYTGYAAPAAARLKANVQVVFDELK